MGCCGSCGGEAPNHVQENTPEKNDTQAQDNVSDKDNSSQSNQDKAQDKEKTE